MEEPSRLLTNRFGTVAPSGKPQSEIPQFIIQLPIKIETWIPPTEKNGDPKNGRGWWVCLWGEGSA